MDEKDITEITSSERKYLRAIYHLGNFSDYQNIRPIDVAAYLGVSRPSVTAALRRLQKKEMVDRSLNCGIVLTEKGNCVIKCMIRRFTIIESFLENIFTIDRETAERDAWNIERVISNQSVDEMSQFLNKNKI